jgi:hypothetical protein
MIASTSFEYFPAIIMFSYFKFFRVLYSNISESGSLSERSNNRIDLLISVRSNILTLLMRDIAEC